MKRYFRGNVRETALSPREKQREFTKSRDLHKAFNKDGIILLVKALLCPK